MAKTIDISSKLDNSKPSIKIGEKTYEVNNSLETMMRLEELVSGISDIGTIEKMLTIALGKEAVKEINIKTFSFRSFQYLLAGIFAAIQDTEDVEAIVVRFQNS